MTEQEEKNAIDAESEARMREYLRSLSWEEKVESIRRMNEFGRMARAAMREAHTRPVAARSILHGAGSSE
jgi:hypothetical protein